MALRSLAAFGCAAPIAAFAVGLGEAQVRSNLGDALDVRIPVIRDAGEEVDRDCFTSLPRTVDGIRAPERVSLAIDNTDPAKVFLRATTPGFVRELAIALTVRAGCPGANAGRIERTYVLLLDPAPAYVEPRSANSSQEDAATAPARAIATPLPKAAAPVQSNLAVDSPIAGSAVPPPMTTATRATGKKRKKPDAPSLDRGTAASVEAPPRNARGRKSTRPLPGEFVLKLSRDAGNASNDTALDPARRAELRERNVVLDDDDRVASILALRRRVGQLEAQLAQLTLRMETVLPTGAAPLPAATGPAASVPAASVPVAATAPTNVAPVTPPPASSTSTVDETRSRLWLLLPAVLVGLIAVWLAVRLARRHRMDGTSGAFDMAAREPGTWTATAAQEEQPHALDEHIEIATLRADATEVIAGARALYERANVPAAIRALETAIENDPAETRVWLALFEVLRSERLAGRYADLSRRFHERFGGLPQWLKVCAFGNELDPLDPLYAGTAPLAGAFDPLTENWLESPMQHDVGRAAELHEVLALRSGALWAEANAPHSPRGRPGEA